MALEKEAEKEGHNIRSLFSDLAGFLTYFQRAVGFIADNFRHCKQEAQVDGETFPLELAIRSVLNHFLLGLQDVDFLTQNILEGQLPYGVRFRSGDIQRQNFYDVGFRYHDIVDSDEHDTLSKLFLYDFSRTPEAFLARIATKAMVVGISATANISTNIGNFDLDYLKDRLGDTFTSLSKAQLEAVRKTYEQCTQGYSDIDIKASFIGPDSLEQGIDMLTDLVDDKEAAQGLYNHVRMTNPEETDVTVQHLLFRYVRLLCVWKYFLEHNKIRGMLCLFNKFPKNDDQKFSLEKILKYAEFVEEVRANGTPGESLLDAIIILRGSDFGKQKQEIMQQLGAGKRLFIISTYQTVGAGQNLQYPIPEGETPIQVNEYPARNTMDLNGIYLDRPTNLLVNIFSGELKSENFIKYVFQLEFLVENGAISPRIFHSKLDEAFHYYVGRRERRKKQASDYFSLYHTDAYNRFANKLLIQAIGRICRTYMKACEIHILADSNLKKELQRFTVPESVIPVKEYTILHAAAGEYDPRNEIQKEYENRGSTRSGRIMAFINRQIHTPWTTEKVTLWQDMRLWVLKCPCLTSRKDLVTKWEALYVELPCPATTYQYTQTLDYGDVTVFFSSSGGTQIVSETTARLPELLDVPQIRKLFEREGWATCFAKSSLILAPPVFNNIYKGALGEVVGQYVFEEMLGVRLSSLDIAEYELFDFKTDENLFVDFKLWRGHVAIDANAEREKILRKMTECSAERAVIVNILAGSDSRFFPRKSHDDRIVEIPFLIDKGRVSEEALTFLYKEFFR
jgi:hypothetical protein